MNRRSLLEAAASTAFLALMPQIAVARNAKDAAIPWQRLRRALDGRLLALDSPLATCRGGTACTSLFGQIGNPYFVRDNPALTQTLGWADAWTSASSWYAVEAKHAGDIATAVTFARDYGLKLAVRGGGHSYLGTSNAPDSLLAWTRGIDEVEIDGDVVTIGTGNIWARAYDAVTTRAGRYVQGGGCCTVNVGGLVASGGFGSFSKRYGTAASSLLEAEVVTADGKIRTVNAGADPDLFWALKGGGGGTFGIVTRMKLRLHDLTPYAGACIARIKASSDAAYHELIERFMAFYKDALFNEHWGESVEFASENRIAINMVSSGLSTEQITALWQPFFDSIKRSPSKFEIQGTPITLAIPARQWWNETFWRKNFPSAIKLDPRPGRGNDWWWAGDSGQVGWFIYNYESIWIPQSLLDDAERSKLGDAIFAATRRYSFALHFNKGLAGAPPDAIARASDTATNPQVTDAFALAICAEGTQGVFPGIAGREPNMSQARDVTQRVSSCINELRAVAPNGGAYVSESGFFEQDYGARYWGSNYAKLQAVKRQYDPHNFFSVRNGVRA